MQALGVADRQHILDAAAALQQVRQAAVVALSDGGTPTGARLAVVSRNRAELGAWTMRSSLSWRRLLSTRTAVTGGSLSRSMPNNRRLVADRGLQMVSVFDHDSTDVSARSLLEAEPDGIYFYSYAPIQMRIVDNAKVLLEGPAEGDTTSILSLTSPQALHAAFTYWWATVAAAQPCSPSELEPSFTPRERSILQLLVHGATDDHIAAVLDLSVRTIRGDVHDIMTKLDVRSRFAAGYAYAALRPRPAPGDQPPGDPASPGSTPDPGRLPG